MKQIKYIFLFSLLSISICVAQKKLSLEEINNFAFQSEEMQSVYAMQNSNQYALIEYVNDKRIAEINLYDFATLTKNKTIFSTADFPIIPYIGNYIFDSKEEKILIGTEVEPIYRRSFVATYYLYDIKSKKLQKISGSKILEPTFSQDGSKVAYAFQNDLYIYDLETQKTSQVTKDGEKNHIINGISDWVYEEEFGVVRMFEWSLDGTKLAYVKFDETEVPEYSMDIYTKSLYPTQEVFKYPKAGEKNSKVSLHLFDLEKNSTVKVDLSEYNDFYIPRIKWTKENQYLSFQIINRHQNDLKLYFLDIKTNQKRVIINERDKAYVEVTDNLTFLKDNSFIWTSEKDGYNHIYHYDKNGKLIDQITKGKWEVTEYYGIDEKQRTLYYQSVENGSIRRDVYSIQLNGKNKKLLSNEIGTNSAVFSPNFQFFIKTYSSSKKAPTYTLNLSENGNLVKNILSNNLLESKLVKYDLPEKEFFTIQTVDGIEMNAWIMKPTNFDKEKKYPLLMYQYSGPGSQVVADRWWNTNDFWHAMLTEKGYIVVAVDGRGTGFKGSHFKKVTQFQLGKLEVEDQIIAADYLKKNKYIDPARIGIWGWSFGGFMSSNCLLKGHDVFKAAIAVAPVTNWRFYDTIYTERYLKTPGENARGYDDNSPIFFANLLKGNLLLIHGTADDNVHIQNTMTMIEALIQNQKMFDWLIYPDKNHGIYGGYTRLHLYSKMTNFILLNL